MPRHSITESRVQAVIHRLADMVLRLGSVNAVAQGLSQALDDQAGRIYPNRIHGLLTDDPSRGVNTATLDLLEQACATFQPEASSAEWVFSPDAIRSMVATHAAKLPRREALATVADELGIPVGVVAATAPESTKPAAAIQQDSRLVPDWSWQDDAVEASLKSLSQGAIKTGLIVPTGGGKTRIALRIALGWLAAQEPSRTVLWVTHRHLLKTQARRTLQALMRESGLGSDEATQAFERVHFAMTSTLSRTLVGLGDSLSLVIVDEAHHAAASSYAPILNLESVPGLFLTATPNRSDALPIGIDEITYTITYRELFRRGCIIEPVFDPPEDMPDLDWNSPEGLRDLADYLLERTDTDFAKPLVAVSLRERAEHLYGALLEQLEMRDSHPLVSDDIAFVHGDANSRGLPTPGEFLDEFAARPAGILIATSQLVGEGFDDPSIDAAVITYPSSSIGHLMQVAGRALRAAPGKSAAHVVQVHDSPLEYHFEQRWLYQDISDALRPALVDLTYSSPADLEIQVRRQLEEHHVFERIAADLLEELQTVSAGVPIHLMFTGLPYFGGVDDFEAQASWSALFVTPTERHRFVHAFNELSSRTEDLRDQAAWLSQRLGRTTSSQHLRTSYANLVPATEHARREIAGTPYYGSERRGYRPGRNTTWLKYVTFTFAPAVPPALEELFADSYNRNPVLAQYVTQPEKWRSALRLELPIHGSEALLLDAEQAVWLNEQLNEIEHMLATSSRPRVLIDLEAWRVAIDTCPLPRRVIEHIEQLLRPERREQHLLALDAEPTAKTTE
jgi:superfamily II DNA or RNA helicase